MLLDEYNFKREVLDAPGPVLVDFWAVWCGPCPAMTRPCTPSPAILPVCKVNTETNPHLAAKFDVSAIPLLLIFRGGMVVRRYAGVTSEATRRADLTALSNS